MVLTIPFYFLKKLIDKNTLGPVVEVPQVIYPAVLSTLFAVLGMLIVVLGNFLSMAITLVFLLLFIPLSTFSILGSEKKPIDIIIYAAKQPILWGNYQ